MNPFSPKSRSGIHFLLAGLISGALVACTPIQAPATNPGSAPAVSTVATKIGDTETGEAERTPNATAARTEGARAAAPDVTMVQPLDQAECEGMQAAVAAALDVEWRVEVTGFPSDLANRRVSACTISATGTGVEFSNFVDVAQRLREILMVEGWNENQAYLADAPTGTASGFEKEGQLALVSVFWEPTAEAACPDDEPINSCDVEPSQQLFTVIIELVQTDKEVD
jgi:hypothetical protein